MPLSGLLSIRKMLSALEIAQKTIVTSELSTNTNCLRSNQILLRLGDLLI